MMTFALLRRQGDDFWFMLPGTSPAFSSPHPSPKTFLEVGGKFSQTFMLEGFVASEHEEASWYCFIS